MVRVGVCATAIGLAATAHAQPLALPAPDIAAGPLVNATVPGALTAYATLLSAGFEWRITGDDNGNCAVALEFRRAGEIAWRPAQPLLRVEHGLWTHGEDPGNLLAGSLFFLDPGTPYEARLTLSDPDGGSDQRVVSFSTRGGPAGADRRTLHVIPGAGGGSGSTPDPFRGLAAADAAAQPGDLMLLESGSYHGTFRPTHDGTTGIPIVYRGVDQATVILDGDGGTAQSSHCIRLVGRTGVHVENMSLINCLKPVNADSSVAVVVRDCIIRPINQLTGTEGIRAAYSRDLLIADNTIQMPGQWATIGRTGSYGTGGYGILIEGTGHVICHNTVTEAWDAISIPVTGTAMPAWTTSNVDIYENFVDRASDDGIQADAVQHNVRIFHNRLLNTGSTVSFQPAFGGPGYILFNEMYNNRIEPYKFHQETSYGWTQETSGFIAYHNTSVCNRHAWYETGIWRHGAFRNNLLLGGRINAPSFLAGYSYPGASFDYDGFNRVNGYPTLITFSGSSYANLPAFYAGTGNEQHGIEVGIGVFAGAVLPHHPEWNYPDGYGAPYAPGDNDLRLASGSAAIDKGLTLANINESFSGAAPDLGCYESGRAVPAYGPRPLGQSLTASAMADVVAGMAPLRVQFTGGSQNARGIVVGYRWDFGDGTSPSGERNPVHTYTLAGPHAAVLTVTDDDGIAATRSVTIIVGQASTDVAAASTRLSLAQNAPNPFGASTTIRFALPRTSFVSLCVYDLRGGRVRTLMDGVLPEGEHAVAWDGRTDAGRDAQAGVYFLGLDAVGISITRRMALIR